MAVQAKFKNLDYVQLDYKILQEALKKHLIEIIRADFLKSLGHNFEEEFLNIINAYSKKVSATHVNKIVNDVLKTAEINLAFVSRNIFPLRILYYSHMPASEDIDAIYPYVILDNLRYSKLFNIINSRQSKIESPDDLSEEELKFVNQLYSVAMSEIESSAPDLYYSIYGAKLLKVMIANYKYFESPFNVIPELTEIYSEFIKTVFKNFKNANDNDLIKLSIAGVLTNQYYVVKDWDRYLTELSDILEVKRKSVVVELLQIGINQYKNINQLPILLKNLGLYLIPINEFVKVHSSIFKNFYHFIFNSLFHFIVSLILSKYPQSMVSGIINVPDKTDILEKEILKLV